MIDVQLLNVLVNVSIVGSIFVICVLTPRWEGPETLVLRLALAMTAVPYLMKIWERVHGDSATWIDTVRDGGICLLLATTIWFHWNRV